MKDYNPHDPVNMIGEAYERLVEKTMHGLHIDEGVDPKEDESGIEPVVEQEEEKASDMHADKPDDAYACWIEDKKFLLKNSALDYLVHARDETTVVLRRLSLPQHLSNDVSPTSRPRNNTGPKTARSTSRPAKHNTQHYKKLNNKSFRRLQ